MRDENGAPVAATTGAKGAFVIENVRLWHPMNAYRYTAEITFGENLYDQIFGVCSVEVHGTQFLINGEPFYFKGFGKHEDSNSHGRDLDEVLNVKDLALTNWLGANSFHTSHYPYSEEMMNLCDREGIWSSTKRRPSAYTQILEQWRTARRDTFFPVSAAEYCSSLYNLARECDPARRPTTIVGVQNDYRALYA